MSEKKLPQIEAAVADYLQDLADRELYKKITRNNGEPPITPTDKYPTQPREGKPKLNDVIRVILDD